MNLTVGIAIIISAITLVGMVAIAVNDSAAPAHAVKPCRWFPQGSSGGPPCFTNQHQCETTTGIPCHSKS